jgi:hypothetical protein
MTNTDVHGSTSQGSASSALVDTELPAESRVRRTDPIQELQQKGACALTRESGKIALQIPVFDTAANMFWGQ